MHRSQPRKVFVQDLGATCAAGKHLENIRNTDAHAANAGPTAALIGVEGDALLLVIDHTFGHPAYLLNR